MATITSTGLGSGLDVTGIVSSLMAINRRPLDLLEQQTEDLNSELSVVGKLKSFMSTFRDRSQSLSDRTLWSGTTSSSSDTAKVGVSSTSNAAAGRYAVAVQALAAQQTLASSTNYASSDAVVGRGTLTIDLGSWTEDPAGGAPTAFTSKSSVTINIGSDDPLAPDATLEEVRDAINGADAGVVATIINDANGSRLSLRSAETGEENGFRVSVTEYVDDGDAATGLSALAYDPVAGTSQMNRTAVASNALATLNGIAIESASNTLTEVADGLTLTLSAVTTSDIEVIVSQDTGRVKKAIEDFVSSYNDFVKYLRDQTKYDEASKEGGILQGDSTFLGMQSQLRGVLNTDSSASLTWARLADIGIEQQKDGTLKITTSDLDDALQDLPELEKLFSAESDNYGEQGFATRFKDLADSFLDFEGTFETRDASLKSRIDRNEDQQDTMEQRLSVTEERLYDQYETLDATMASLNSLSQLVSQQLAMLNSGN